MRKALDELLYLAPLKEKGRTDAALSLALENEGASSGCHPWDRSDLCKRLRSFKV